jgi:LysM repeat protein
MLFFFILQYFYKKKPVSFTIWLIILLGYAPVLGYAQPVFSGVWSDKAALEAWIGGDFHANIRLSEHIDTTKEWIQDIDSCVAHRYTGALPLADGLVFSFVAGRHFFENDNVRYTWLVAATTDGYACKDCGMALSASLWEYSAASGVWSMTFEERDFTVTGAAGVAPQVAFATIGAGGRIGVFVWQRRSLDAHHHFYLADIFTLLDSHFTSITQSNIQNNAERPNICNAVSGAMQQPYSYESDYEIPENAALDLYDINVRKQGTLYDAADKNAILPLDRTYFYHWNIAKTQYALMDSIDNIVFVPYMTKENETIKTIAQQQRFAENDIMAYNPLLAEAVGGSLDAKIPANTQIFVRQIDLTTLANLQPSLASIEDAVGVPDDEKAAIDSLANDSASTNASEKTNEKNNKINTTPPVIETYTPPKKETIKIIPTPEVQITNPEATNPESPIQKANTHIVQPKETLFGICKKYNVQMTDLQRINGLPADFSVKIGQVLDLGELREPAPIPQATNPQTQIPKPEVTNPQTQIPNPKATNPQIPNPHKSHTVAAGETLFSIARKYKTSVGHLQKANKLKDYIVYIGQVLVL